MIVNLTEKELKNINYCLKKVLINAQGLAAIGACRRSFPDQIESLKHKLEIEAKDNCGYSIVVDYIEWDTDGNLETLEILPKEVELPFRFIHINDHELTGNVIDDISDYLASEYGYCPKRFLVEVKSTVTIHSRK